MILLMVVISKVNVTYYGDNIYNISSNSTVFNVTDRVNSTLDFTVPVFVVDVADSINVTTNFPNGVLEVYVDGIKQDNVNINNNIGVIDLAGLSAGNHTIAVSYAGDYDYTPFSDVFNIDVLKLQPNIDVRAPDTIEGGNVDIEVSVLGNETGYITFVVKDTKYVVNIEKGSAKVSLSGLDYGDNNISIIYSGDSKYYNLTTSAVVNVHLTESSCSIDVADVIVGETVNIIVNVNSEATGTVKLTVNNRTYETGISDARAVVSVSDLSVSNYTVYAMYNGDKYFSKSNCTSSFLVKSNETIKSDIITKGYNSGCDYQATFYDLLGNPLVNSNVTMSVDGVDYNLTTDSEGIARLDIGLGIGNHTIVLYNPVSDVETHSSVFIEKPLIENKDIVCDFNSGAVYKVRVMDGDNNPVGAGVKFTIPLNGKKYVYTTDKNGYLKIKIDKRFTPSLTNDKLVYKIKLSYRGYTIQNTITVKKTLKTSKIVKVKKSASKLVLKASLKHSNGKAIKGKKITFKFRGKTYSAKTNSKGIAKVTVKKNVIKKLKAGKNYKVKISYLTDSVKSWVQVRK